MTATIFIGPKSATDELAKAVLNFLGRVPIESETALLTHGMIRADDKTKWFGVDPIVGNVILKAPTGQANAGTVEWGKMQDDASGISVFYNASDLVAVKLTAD